MRASEKQQGMSYECSHEFLFIFICLFYFFIFCRCHAIDGGNKGWGAFMPQNGFKVFVDWI